MGARGLLWWTLLALLAIAATVSADPDKDEERPSHAEREAPPGQAKKETDGPARAEASGGPRADPDAEPETRRPGNLEKTDEGVEGRYVGFVDAPETCALQDHRAAGVVFFRSVRLSGPCQETHVERSEFDLRTKDAWLAAHDAPAGLLHFHAQGEANVTFDLAAGVELEPASFGHVLRTGGMTARFVAPPASVERTATGLIVRGATGNFLADAPASNLLATPQLRAAVEAGALAGNVELLFDEGRPVVDVMRLDDVQLRATPTTHGSLRVWVDADLETGRAFAVHLPASTFDTTRLEVSFFDVDEAGLETPAPISLAADLWDASHVAEGEGAEYAAERAGPVVHVVVSVPRFSAHLFEISSLEAFARPSVLGGLVLGLLASGEAAAIMFMGRRKR